MNSCDGESLLSGPCCRFSRWIQNDNTSGCSSSLGAFGVKKATYEGHPIKNETFVIAQ